MVVIDFIKKYFKMIDILSPDCKIIHGYKNVAVYDLTRQSYYIGPKFNNIEELGKDEFEFLKENDIVITIPKESSMYFQEIENSYYSYSDITNALIEYNPFLDETLSKLELLGCDDIALLINKFNYLEIWNQFKKINSNSLNSIELHINDSELSLNDLINIFKIYQEFNFIIPYVYSANQELIIAHSKSEHAGAIQIFPIESFNSKSIDQTSFFCNLKLFTESVNHNPYFNKKLIIDIVGNIKNDIESIEIFGNNELPRGRAPRYPIFV